MEQANQHPDHNLQIDFGALPQDLDVPGFASAYEEHRVANEDSAFSTLLTFIGYGVLLVGILTLIFGPKSVMVNAFRGPDLFQMILLNPGPVASLGFLLVAGARLLNGNKQQLTPEAYLLHSYSIEWQGELPSGQRLQVTYLGDNRFQFSSVVDDAATDGTPAGA